MPACSIIIPVHNQISLTRSCLDALLDRPPSGVSWEIVVVDDASTDATAEMLAMYPGKLTVIRHDLNRGFATACNAGAAAASGELLVFLNNDVAPYPGWLDALVAYARKHPSAAVVGSKLLYPDQTVQHAGVVICHQDRYPRHVYRGYPSDHPAVNRSRRFQAVTGACMLIRRTIFEQAGGFDDAFLNGYEDVDLCLRLGEQGHEVHYCHDSVLVHFESASRTGRRDEISHNVRLYDDRWRDRVRPDEIDVYLEDRLLTFTYPHQDLYPLQFRLAPELGVLDEPDREREADRRLTERAQQVWQLTSENVRLRLQLQALTDRPRGDPEINGELSPPTVPPSSVRGITVRPTATEHEMDVLRQRAIEMFVAQEAAAPERPPGRLRQILAQKQRPIPLTVTSAQGVASADANGHALWCFWQPDGVLTVQASLAPGRYLLRLKAASSEAVGLMVRVGGEPPRRLVRLGARCENLVARLDVQMPTQELRFSLSGPVSIAVLGDIALWLEVEESKQQIVTRKLVSKARRSTRVKRFARSPIGKLLRSMPGLLASQPSRPTPALAASATLIPSVDAVRKTEALRFAPWMQERFRERQRLYQTAPEPGLLSLITSAWNTPASYLDALATSVMSQWGHRDFEWIVLDNGSTNPESIAFLGGLTQYPQVKLFRVSKNLGIVGGLRYCVERATGRYVVPLDSDDYLYPDCLRIMTWHIKEHGYPPLLYSDEDKIRDGAFQDEYLKPDWDPVLFLNSCYIAHLCAIDRELALKLGIYADRGAEGCHDWDTFTRFMLAGHTPVHVPEVIYSWRMHPASAALDINSKSYLYDSQEHVLRKYLAAQPDPERYRLRLSPHFNGLPDWWFERTRTDARPLLTVLLCQNPGTPAVRDHVEQLLSATGHPDHRVEAISIDSGLRTLAALATEQAARDGLVHLMVEGMQLDGDQWPYEILGLMERHPDTVMVGGCALNLAGQVVAAGEYLGFGGDCGCPDLGHQFGHPGYFGQLLKQRSVSAVSSMLAVVDAAFLVGVLERGGHPEMSLRFFGAWAGAYALRTRRRVVYSPFLIGRGDLNRAEWDGQINPSERAAFVRANRDILPDTRYLSPLLSLDPASPYVAVSAAQRHAFAQQHWLGRRRP